MPQFDLTVVGELNLDLILYGLPEVLDPERELYVDRLSLTLGSSSAIFAHNLAVLGAKVGFISLVGNDSFGQTSLDRLAESGTNVSKIRRAKSGAESGTGTGLTVILPRTGFRNILTYPGTMNEMRFEDLDLDYLSAARHFHLASFFLHRALLPRMAELFQKMKAAGLTTSLDTNDDPADRWEDGLEEVLPQVDIFSPNEREAKKICKVEDENAALESLAQRVPLVVMKRGSRGAVAQRGKERVECPAFEVEPVDLVGAGDSFNAGFLYQYLKGQHLQGADLETCMRYGNLAAAFSTTRSGGTEAFRDRKHLEDFFLHYGQHGA